MRTAANARQLASSQSLTKDYLIRVEQAVQGGETRANAFASAALVPPSISECCDWLLANDVKLLAHLAHSDRRAVAVTAGGADPQPVISALLNRFSRPLVPNSLFSTKVWKPSRLFNSDYY